MLPQLAGVGQHPDLCCTVWPGPDHWAQQASQGVPQLLESWLCHMFGEVLCVACMPSPGSMSLVNMKSEGGTASMGSSPLGQLLASLSMLRVAVTLFLSGPETRSSNRGG
jgi:hypothetical protein